MNVDLSDRVAARDLRDLPPPFAALPVLRTFVPPEAISQASGKYGKKLYAVTQLKVGGGQDAYQATLMENGQISYEWIGSDGGIITNIYRVDTGAMSTSNPMNPDNNMNNTNMNNLNNRRDTTMMNSADTSMKRDTNTRNKPDSMLSSGIINKLFQKRITGHLIAGESNIKTAGNFAERISFYRRRLPVGNFAFTNNVS